MKKAVVFLAVVGLFLAIAPFNSFAGGRTSAELRQRYNGGPYYYYPPHYHNYGHYGYGYGPNLHLTFPLLNLDIYTWGDSPYYYPSYPYYYRYGGWDHYCGPHSHKHGRRFGQIYDSRTGRVYHGWY